MKNRAITFGVNTLFAAVIIFTKAQAGQVLEVNQKGGAQFKTIADAAKVAKPGDTIRLAPGSGPYREIMYIKVSGEPDKPVIIDGSGETVTGADPLVFKEEKGKRVADLTELFANLKNAQGFQKKDEMWTNEKSKPATPIPLFPSVLIYKGKRIFQDSTTGQFTDYVIVSPDCKKLTLKDGVDPKGFEIGVRDAAVRVINASYQTYRNIKASGCLNDGFNIHGKGKAEIFENVEGFQNLDEGFSSHDGYECEIYNSKFWENENGIQNAADTKTIVKDVEIYDNSGIGFGFSEGEVTAENVTIRNSGVNGVRLRKGIAAVLKNISVTESEGPLKPYLTSQESCTTVERKTIVIDPAAKVEGEIQKIP